MAGIMGLGCQTSSPKIMQVHTASKIPTADNGRAQDGSSKNESTCAYVVVWVGGLGWWFGSLGVDDFVNLEPI